MTLPYGVLRGRVDRFQREEDRSAPHLQIRIVDAHQQPWRVPVNVRSTATACLALHLADPLQGHPILAGLDRIQPGFTELDPPDRSPATALDYLRAPLFAWKGGVAAPPAGPAAPDDLLDLIATYLRQLAQHGGEIFSFGARFPAPGRPAAPRPIDAAFGTRQGLHNIHMNQGSPHDGSCAGENGVFQDGGLILRLPARAVGIFLRFQSQRLPTADATGHPLPGAEPIPPGCAPPDGRPAPPPPAIAAPPAYIERALVGPAGGAHGREAVVIGNTTAAPIDLRGWSIEDQNGDAETIGAITLPPGESRRVLLSGAGARLGSRGGTIRLRAPDGALVHAVSYAHDDAHTEDRYIRFR